MVYGGDIWIKTRKVQSTWWSSEIRKSTLVEYVLRVRTHFSIFYTGFSVISLVKNGVGHILSIFKS